ncbi:MAG TPA: Glu-tRNA(Gln) amidotransferase GatDE subunit D, partial [Candidatus Atribacteria bacterium]|nr:Glu-tRNA(Gln) amidotransferase GatDE subunit D [Candidatus Atribacteria bacterium]
MKKLEGYRGISLSKLLEANATIGDRIKITGKNFTYEGILMPRAGVCDDKHIVIKLDNGYNIGVKITREISIKVIEKTEKREIQRKEIIKKEGNLPQVSIISTGGTIASRVDYKTGAVYPALTAEDLYYAVPELEEIAEIDAEILFSIFSENMTPKHWEKIALKVAEKIEEGFQGVVIARSEE